MPSCVAVGCTTKPGQGVTMHRFPADSNRRAIWTAKVRRENWEPNKNSYLCDVS